MNVYIYNNLIKTPVTEESVIALGSFYSIHKGHQELFSEVKSIADNKNILSGALIFAESEENKKNETYPLNWRVRSLEEIGFDFVIIFDKNRTNFEIEGNEFIESLVKSYNVKNFVCGKDFKFGKLKKYSSIWLKDNYETSIVETVKKEESKISTSLINSILEQGDLVLAKELLGRDFSVYGEIIHGESRGKQLGFKTANINVDDNAVNFSDGVYLTYIVFDGKKYPSITSVGKKPTFHNNYAKTYETHILNFNEDIYGKFAEVFFIDKLRDQEKFIDSKSLVEQIRRDKDNAIKYFVDNEL